MGNRADAPLKVVKLLLFAHARFSFQISEPVLVVR